MRPVTIPATTVSVGGTLPAIITITTTITNTITTTENLIGAPCNASPNAAAFA
jgi:hypothetical protein